MFTLRLQMCLEHSAAASSLMSSGLVRLLDAVSKKNNSDNSATAIRFTGDDIYKICALIHAKDDPLHLREEHSFVNAIAHSYWHHVDETLSPFQKALIERVLPSNTSELNNTSKNENSNTASFMQHDNIGTSGSSVETTIKESSSSSGQKSKNTKSLSFVTTGANSTKGEPTMNERLSAIWEIINERQETAQGNEHDKDNDDGGDNFSENNASEMTENHNKKKNYNNNNYAIGNDAMQQIQGHITAMEGHFKELTLFDLCRVIKALAMINYQNYEHTSLLGRCACAVIGNEPLPRRELCQLYFNLHKLNTRDSLTPIVNRIISMVHELTAEEVFLVAQSLERHTNTVSSGARLMRALAIRAIDTMKDTHSASYHRALLVAMSRYMLQQHPSVAIIVHDLHRFVNSIHVNDLLDILQACVDLKVYRQPKCKLPTKSSMENSITSSKSHKGKFDVNKENYKVINNNSSRNNNDDNHVETSNPYPMLITRLTSLAPEVDVHMISNVMTILSTLPTETTEVMQRLMTRMENEAGKLSVSELTNILNLLSTYPPARGSVCVVSLAFAAAVRARGIDHALLEDILISLAMMQHFTDDFYEIFEVMQRQKGGIRQFNTVASLLEYCTPQVVADTRGEALISNAIIIMASKLTDNEVVRCRHLLKRLNFNNREVMVRLSSRASQNALRDGARHRYPTAEDELEMSMLESN